MLGKDKVDVAWPLGVGIADVVEIPFLDPMSRTFFATAGATPRPIVTVLSNDLQFGKIINRLGHFSGVWNVFTNWAHGCLPSEDVSKGLYEGNSEKFSKIIS